MAWTTPTTRSTGDLVTAAIWNTDMVDNLIHLHDGLPGCRANNSANISIADSTVTVLTFDSERYDTDNIHSTTTNTGRLTCQTAGKYAIFGNVEWGSGSVGYRALGIRLNGTTYVGANRYTPDGSGGTTPFRHSHGVSVIYNLAVGDYLELIVYQTQGSSINVNASGNYSPEFGMQKAG